MVVVVGVVVGVADGRSACGWCCGCFLDNEIYYFIAVVTLFYCDVYLYILKGFKKLVFTFFLSKIPLN